MAIAVSAFIIRTTISLLSYELNWMVLGSLILASRSDSYNWLAMISQFKEFWSINLQTRLTWDGLHRKELGCRADLALFCQTGRYDKSASDQSQCLTYWENLNISFKLMIRHQGLSSFSLSFFSELRPLADHRNVSLHSCSYSYVKSITWVQCLDLVATWYLKVRSRLKY